MSSSFKKRANEKRIQQSSLRQKQFENTSQNTPSSDVNIEAKINPISLREAKNVVGGGSLEKIPVDQIDLSPYQPRIITGQVLDSLESLAKDIERNGQLNPITVRQKGSRYELIGGERRFRAVKDILKLDFITALVKSNLSDEKAAIQAFSDNINREDLSDYENISQIKQICDEFGYPFENADFVTEKFSIEKSRYFRLKYILDLPLFILSDLSENPNLISGYIAQELKIEINKQLESKSESEIHNSLRETWSTYVIDFKKTGKRNKSFVTALSGGIPERTTETNQQDEGFNEETPAQNSRSTASSAPVKVDFKTENGVKFGSMRTEKGTQGKNILKLRISLEADLDKDKTKKIENFFNELNK